MFRFGQMIINVLEVPRLEKVEKHWSESLSKNMKNTISQFLKQTFFLRKNFYLKSKIYFTFIFKQYLDGLPPLQG